MMTLSSLYDALEAAVRGAPRWRLLTGSPVIWFTVPSVEIAGRAWPAVDADARGYGYTLHQARQMRRCARRLLARTEPDLQSLLARHADLL